MQIELLYSVAMRSNVLIVMFLINSLSYKIIHKITCDVTLNELKRSYLFEKLC